MIVVRVAAGLIGVVLFLGGCLLAFSLGASGTDVSTVSWFIQMILFIACIAFGAATIFWATGFGRRRRRARARQP